MFEKGHAPFKRQPSTSASAEQAKLLSEGIRSSVRTKHIVGGTSYIVFTFDEDSQVEKCGMESVDKHFDMLMKTMPLFPGPSPSPAVLKEAWLAVAPALVLAKRVGFFASEEAQKHSVLWSYAWKHAKRDHGSRSVKMARLKCAIREAMKRTGQKVEDESQVVELSDGGSPSIGDCGESQTAVLEEVEVGEEISIDAENKILDDILDGADEVAEDIPSSHAAEHAPSSQESEHITSSQEGAHSASSQEAEHIQSSQEAEHIPSSQEGEYIPPSQEEDKIASSQEAESQEQWPVHPGEVDKRMQGVDAIPHAATHRSMFKNKPETSAEHPEGKGPAKVMKKRKKKKKKNKEKHEQKNIPAEKESDAEKGIHAEKESDAEEESDADQNSPTDKKRRMSMGSAGAPKPPPAKVVPGVKCLRLNQRGNQFYQIKRAGLVLAQVTVSVIPLPATTAAADVLQEYAAKGDSKDTIAAVKKRIIGLWMAAAEDSRKDPVALFGSLVPGNDA